MVLVFILAAIGAVAVVLFIIDSLWSVLELVTSYLMPFFLPAEVQPLTKKFGPWAVVTGCTDGIGKQYSLELARRGFSLVLVSRNPDKLKAVATQIESEHKVKTKIIVADFSNGATIYSHIEEELKGIEVGVLVNNVGTQYDYPMYMCEVPPPKAWEIINVNVGAVTAMSRLLLPAMAERGRGAIVNVSSGSELMPLPLMTVYAASKAYVRSFTIALREEYASRGIQIQHVTPMFVTTKMNAFSQQLMEGNLLIPDSVTYARHAVNTLGRVQNTTGYWTHGLQVAFIKLAPAWISAKIGFNINKQFRDEYFRNNKIKSN